MTSTEKAFSMGLALAALGASLLLVKVRPLPDLQGAGPWRSRVSCKAITRPEETRGCSSIETDLTATKDGIWALSHEPELRGRRLSTLPYDEVSGELSSLPDLIGRLYDAKTRLDLVDLDIKDHFMGPRDFAALLELNLPHVEELARHSRVVVMTTPAPWKYAVLHDWVRRHGLAAKGVVPGLEVMDYEASQAVAWGLPLSPTHAFFLPVARLASRFYARLNAGRVPWYVMQEKTAASWTAQPAVGILCWTRDQASGEPPEACSITERQGYRAQRPRPKSRSKSSSGKKT